MDTKMILMLVGGALLLGTTSYLIMHSMKRTTDVSAIPSDVVSQFKSWSVKYGKKYADPDFEAYRLGIYYENIKMIQSHPSSSSYTLDQNQFMDLTNTEFKSTYLGLLNESPKMSGSVHVNSGSAPSSINWFDKGDVSAIKNQGQCGSCWAFSTTGSLESADALFGTALGDFSEQQLVDCSSSYGNQGCNGGLMDNAFKYVIANGITTESAYPYKAVTGTCKTKGGSFKISKYTDITQGQCSDLQNAVGTVQPVSIGVDAETWQFYSGGVFDNCGTQLDHGVLAVGYDSSSNWIVKNSWGTSWGMKGFITLKTGNTCGICNTASYPGI